jgi:hypothetical protein
MTKEEIKNLLALATANFPNMQEKNMTPTAVLWDKMLSDIPYQLAEKALVKVLSTAKFFPTVAEIREAAAEITNPLPITAAEAWGQVMEAVRKFGSYRPTEAMEWLSPEVAVMVRRFGFVDICRSEQIDVIRGQFIKLWDSQAKREKELMVLPSPVRNLIQGVAERRLLDA